MVGFIGDLVCDRFNIGRSGCSFFRGFSVCVQFCVRFSGCSVLSRI